MDKEKARREITQIIEKYNKVAAENRAGKYNEEMTKAEFIEPLFEALGWDVRNKYHEDEVIREENIYGKRPDYSFRINGITKFFLEAKPLKADLNNPEFIRQAINYSYTKGCTWAVLTDFEEIRLLNAEVKDANNTFVSLSFNQFIDSFDKLWLLSKESFETGLIDKEAEGWGKKTKKTPFDKQLLADFTRFRELLSKNITKLNQREGITEDQLDESVQRILDRLIFIRNCEDRGLEERKLWEAKNEANVLKKLRGVWSEFDEQYDSRIFDKHLCDELDIDNAVLGEIIEGLYYTKDKSVSYDFSAIEADVLGNIYEQYLGHILKKGEKRASIKESRAHRKEQGIYYTPTYIVDYIVRNTLGELLKDKKTKLDKIKVLDPACGSGSFLIKAFDILNEHYAKKDKGYSQAEIDFKTGLPFTTKVKILQNNIFGVDLDKQAVEIAQLNLLLKIAEKGHRLPMLQQNIQCGNSLIDDPAIAGERAFKWQEQFKEIMKDGGFDVVIGNPPYISATLIEELNKSYYKKRFVSAKGRLDTYGLFIEKAIQLCKCGGYVGFIIPNKFLTNVYFEELRRHILETSNISVLAQLQDTVFESAAVNSVIVVLQKESKPNPRHAVLIQKLTNTSKEDVAKISQSNYLNRENNVFIIEFSKQSEGILEKVQEDSVRMDSICDVRDGIVAGRCKDILFLNKKANESCRKIIFGDDMGRYELNWKGRYVDYRPDFMKKQERIRVREKGLGIRLRIPSIFETEKIITRKTADRIIATYDTDGFYFEQTVHGSILKSGKFDIKYVLGLLNSKLYEYYYKRIVSQSGTIFPQVRIDFLKKLPIKNAPSKTQQPLIRLVDKMLTLNSRLGSLGDKKTDERAKIEDDIKKTDAEIDQFVYKLYGLTEKEIRVVEGQHPAVKQMK